MFGLNICLIKFGWARLLDDILKIKLKNSRGLKSKYKFLGQLVIGAIALFIIIKFSNHSYIYNLYFPFFKNLIWHMGLFFIPFGLFVIIGSSNAVNLNRWFRWFSYSSSYVSCSFIYINFIRCRKYNIF